MTLINAARQAKMSYGRKLIKHFYGPKFLETRSFHPYAEISIDGSDPDESFVMASWLSFEENFVDGIWCEEWYDL